MEIYSGLVKLQRLTAEAVGLAEGGRIGELGAALSELQALAQRLPAASFGSTDSRHTGESAAQREARRQLEEEEIEQGFDNMPV